MQSKSNEIIKQLNRLTNDRNLPMQARNKINEALQHIRELQLKLDTSRNISEAQNNRRAGSLISSSIEKYLDSDESAKRGAD